MGLIKAFSGAVKGVIADQWKEFFSCETISNDVLITKGQKQTTGAFGTKNNANDNVISNGSVVVVNEGQCMIIVDNGAVVEFCAEPGEFVYDTSTEPSLLYGNLGENLGKTFATIGRRFTYGGNTARDQRVYYFNTKEITGNLFGTPNPVPFRVVDKNIGLDVDISVRCNGEYSFKISNPLLFFKSISGNVTDEFRKEEIIGQMKSEFLTALQPGFARISEMGVRYSAIPAHTLELADAMNQALSTKWGDMRGIQVVSVGINSITASQEDEAMIKELQRKAVLRDSGMAAASLADAQSEAMTAAANNSSGAMLGFAGLNFAAQAGGLNAGALYAMNQQQTVQEKEAQTVDEVSAEERTWKCSCGASNTGKFCMECGLAKPAEQKGWKCSCGTINLGKFCMECGLKKPADAPLYRCDKCGWEPTDPKNPPKFCPECGDVFDEMDIK